MPDTGNQSDHQVERKINLLGYATYGCAVAGGIYTLVFGVILAIVAITQNGNLQKVVALAGEEPVFKLFYGVAIFAIAMIIMKFFPRRMFSSNPRGAQALEAFVETGERFQKSRSGQFWVGVVMLCVAALNVAALRFGWIPARGDDYGLIIVCLIFGIPNFLIGMFRMRRKRA